MVDSEQRPQGTVSLTDVRAALPESEELAALVLAADVMDSSAPCVTADDRLDLVMRLFGQTHRDEMAVVTDREGRRVVGMVTKEDVIRVYNDRLFQVDATGGFQSMTDAVRGGRRVEVLGGVFLAEVEVPHRLAGQTLREACLRQEYGVEVVLIHRSGRDSGEFPSPDVRLRAGDRLLVMGSADAVDRLQR